MLEKNFTLSSHLDTQTQDLGTINIYVSSFILAHGRTVMGEGVESKAAMLGFLWRKVI